MSEKTTANPASPGQASGVRVLRGQGVSEAAQRPFQVLDGAVAQLMRAVRLDPQLLSGSINDVYQTLQ